MGNAKPLTGTGQAGQTPSRRVAQRSPASLQCRIRSNFGDIADADLKDISIFGCNIESEADWLQPGRFIAIRLDRTPPLQAIIRWARNGAAGLEFLREIPRDRQDWLALID